jgi:hypothetical protein
MSSLVPQRFLFRFTLPCPRLDEVPAEGGDDLLDLPDNCRLENFAALEGKRNFADVRLAWNERGLAVQVTVRGKEQPPVADPARPRHSDGLTLWLDTRDSRTAHRASRFCHQFHLLPTGGGPDGDEPAFVAAAINRAQQDAPLADPAAALLRRSRVPSGYRLEAFLPAAVLNGFDPDQHPRLGVFYAVRDAELGEQLLGAGPDFPYAEDPSLWAVLELTGGAGLAQAGE